MLKRTFLFIAAALVITSCGKKDISTCPDKVCTEEFATITVSFIDKDGKPATLSSFSAVNKRTGDTLGHQKQYNLYPENVYPVADDGDLNKLSSEGDIINIKAVDSVTKKVKNASLVISGGACACHIKKLSGPDTIQFD